MSKIFINDLNVSETLDQPAMTATRGGSILAGPWPSSPFEGFPFEDVEKFTKELLDSLPQVPAPPNPAPYPIDPVINLPDGYMPPAS
ncbi:MAG: hypothetical protein ACR2RL_22520 [Gammaproteobacteria bacterium]